MKFLRPGIFLLLTTLLAACSAESEAPTKGRPTVGIEQRFPIKVGDQVVQMQVAVTIPEQQKGLMFVREMEQDHGMIFLYEQPRRLSFWMKNTYIPLDIGFFDSKGVLREVHRMFPHDEDSVPSSSTQLRYALEMNQGWFAAHGVKPGAEMDLKALAGAIEARGHPAERYIDIE